MNITIRSFLILCCLFGFFTGAANADEGLPMLAIVWPMFWFAIIPIILIEWAVFKKMHQDFPSGKLLRVTSLSNIISTIIGIPMAWLCLLLVEYNIPGSGSGFPAFDGFWQFFLKLTAGVVWLLPDYGEFGSPTYYWEIPLAFNVLLIPCFFMSYWIEAFVSAALLKTKYQNIKKAVWKGNIYSYAFLLLLGLLFLLVNFVNERDFMYESNIVGSKTYSLTYSLLFC